MKITLVDNANEIRQAFIEKFTMTWDEFKITHKEWIDALAAKKIELSLREAIRLGGSPQEVSSQLSALLKILARYEAA